MAERISVEIGEATLEFETGRIAKQAHGAVICRSGDTMVLSAVCAEDHPRPGTDFFPMTVDYREKFYAVGQIPGNFFRREGRPSEREILVCRLTDRPLRPLFPKAFRNELQVCQTVLSADNVHDPDVLSINAASAALHISKIPLSEPIAAVRVGYIDGAFVALPSIDAILESDIDVVLAGTESAITMVEGSAHEVSEEIMLGALEFGHEQIKKIIGVIKELRDRCGVEKMAVDLPEVDAQLEADVNEVAGQRLRDAYAIVEKHPRHDAVEQVKTDTMATLAERYGEERFAEVQGDISSIFGKLSKNVMRGQVIEHYRRIDGRGLADIRPITIEVGVLPRAHGSALFTRGETQALVTTTLGTSRDEMRLDELTGDEFRRFYLHYNFPPWSVGEVRRISGPGRREIGHGKLAERAIQAILPFDIEEAPEEPVEAGGNGSAKDGNGFPYTVRIVSEITESNGSSSMATVCGGSLSMMDAGVPITEAVAGIAMGLIAEGDQYRVLSDILGDEDHLGDMDFKVCGSRQGITAFQMDTKISGVPREVMQQALDQARQGREFILEQMAAVIAEPREEVSRYSTGIYTIKIDPEKIRDVIGPGGKVIRSIQAATGAEVEIDDDGNVKIAAVDHDSANSAMELIRSITADVEVGQLYHGTVTRIMNFGAFVSLIGNKEGLVHISELAPGRVGQVTDVIDVGDECDVKVIEIDKMGRINLSKVQADIELGRIEPEELETAGYGARREGGGGRDRGDRGGDRGGRRGGGGGRGGGGRGGGGRRERS